MGANANLDSSCQPVLYVILETVQKFKLVSCADPESFDRVFLVDGEGRVDHNTTKSGPSSTHQRNAIGWRFASGPMVAQH